MYKTKDRGLSWNQIYESPFMLNGLFVKYPFVAVCGDCCFLAVTKDEKSWRTETNMPIYWQNDRSHLQDIHLFDSVSALCVGENCVVMKSTNEGDSWTEYITDIDADINTVYVSETIVLFGTSDGELYLKYH